MRFNTGISAMMEFVNAAVRTCSGPNLHRVGLDARLLRQQRRCRTLNTIVLLVHGSAAHEHAVPLKDLAIGRAAACSGSVPLLSPLTSHVLLRLLPVLMQHS